MTYLIGTVQVEDFEHWESTFGSNDSFRAEHGELGYQVFQSLEDPNEITVVFEWDDNENPRAFFESEEMREIMAEAGLRQPPDITPARLVASKQPQQPAAASEL